MNHHYYQTSTTGIPKRAACCRSKDGFPRPLGLGPHAPAILVKDKGHGDQQRGKPAGDAGPRPYAEIVVQRPYDQRKGAGKARAQKGIRRNGRGGVRLEGVDEVVEGGLEDGEEAGPEHDEAEARDDPVDGRAGGPSEQELAGAEEHGAQHHGRQPLLGDGAVAGGVVGAVVQGLVVDVEGAAEHGADQDAQEGQRRDQRPPPAQLAEDDGDGAQLHVQDAVAEAGVQRHEEADGRAEELHRPQQELARQLAHADVPFLEPRVQRPVARLVPQPARLVDEQLRRVALVDEDHGHAEHHHLEDAREILGPAPPEGRLLDDGGRDDGSCGGLASV
ncbi:hypothetical protein J3458_012930 [Metarhizium acridum]|uniref:uncharacterized protein n=1 Tax=Metarhizium acridum TaxID=92637 RepID=UPI001C6D03DF|nr:hypothetical protein J3458_012930 [Metarhizium acridum]